MAEDNNETLDIFGKPLGLSPGEKAVLGEDVRVVLRRELIVETHAKKGDHQEPRILAISRSRCYLLSKKQQVKVEASFNFLKIKLLECTEKKILFYLEDEPRPRELIAEKHDSILIVGLIQAQLRNLFNTPSAESVLRASYTPESLGTEISLLEDTLRQAMETLDPNSLENFITVYGFMCDYYGTPYYADISSYFRNVYMTHAFRTLDITDFEHLSNRDILPLISALKYTQYFDGLKVKDYKLSPDIYESLSNILVHSNTLKNLTLDNCAVRPEILFQYTVAWKSSSKSVLAHLDLSNNPLEEKSIDYFCTALESLQHGLKTMILINCKITPRVGSMIAQSMKKNPGLLYSLTHFDLSANPQIGLDPQGTLCFIQEPQTISTLNLSKCGINFDVVFPVLIRGCQQHLRELNLSQNKPKKSHTMSIGQGMQQFFSSAISLEHIDISDCKLPAELAVAVMEGLSINPNVSNITLDMSFNELNHGIDVKVMSNVMSRLKNVSSLDLSSTGIDLHLARLLEAIGLNRSIKELKIGQNFEGKGRVEGMRELCRLVMSPECSLESLDVSFSKLKDLTAVLLNALIPNDTIKKLNISANNMGAAGTRALVKLILSGSLLEEIHYAYNDIPANGFTNIADALEHNFILRSLPTPVHDLSKVAGKEGVDNATARIQQYLCRNHSDDRFSIELAKRHQHRLLLTSQQSSLISREIIEVEEILEKIERRNIDDEGIKEEKSKTTGIKEEANKVLQLVDGLYSPHQESQQYEAITKRMQTIIEREVEQLYSEFVQENIESMVTQGVKTCPLFLDDQTRETLRQIGHRELSGELSEAKKSVVKKTTPEVINHISGMNLETAAVISELIVDRTLTELEGCTDRLHRILDKTSNSSPSKRMTRIFSFRTEDQKNVKSKKRRIKRDDSDAEEEIIIPSSPLTTQGPSLQHMNKGRPRPVRHHRRKPVALKEQANDQPDSIWTKTSVDEPDNTAAVSSKSKTPEPANKSKTPEPAKSKTPEPFIKPKTPEAVKTDDSKSSLEAEPTSPNAKGISKRKSGLRLFGSRKDKSPNPDKKEVRTSQLVEEEYVVVDTNKKKPPATPAKPLKPKIQEDVKAMEKSEPKEDPKISVNQSDSQDDGENIEDDTKKKSLGRGTNPSAGQLANVMMLGGPIQLKSTKPKKEEVIKEDDGSSSDNSVPVSPTKKTSIAPPVASKPKKGNAKENSQTSSTNTTVKEVINEENTSTDSEKDSKTAGTTQNDSTVDKDQ